MADSTITHKSLTVLGARPRGRPKAQDPLVAQVATWVPDSVYANICKTADQQGVKVSALVRSMLLARFQ